MSRRWRGGQPDCGRARLPAPPRDPPRHQAREHPARRRQQRQGSRLAGRPSRRTSARPSAAPSTTSPRARASSTPPTPAPPPATRHPRRTPRRPATPPPRPPRPAPPRPPRPPPPRPAPAPPAPRPPRPPCPPPPCRATPPRNLMGRRRCQCQRVVRPPRRRWRSRWVDSSSAARWPPRLGRHALHAAPSMPRPPRPPRPAPVRDSRRPPHRPPTPLPHTAPRAAGAWACSCSSCSWARRPSTRPRPSRPSCASVRRAPPPAPDPPWSLAQPCRGACCMAGSDEVAFPEDGTVSAEARELLLALLQKNPDRRLSLQAVLDHPWIRRHTAAAACASRAPCAAIVPRRCSVSRHERARVSALDRSCLVGVSSPRGAGLGLEPFLSSPHSCARCQPISGDGW